MSLFAQPLLDVEDEIAVDLFAGGGGASSGFEQATGRMVTVAINHDAAAVEMHKANHPQTLHLRSDVFEVDPRMVTEGRPVGFLWGSPDCTYHSKARGGKPIRHKNKKRRALAWVMTRWAGQVRPRVIMLENVEEFANWGPLVGPKENLRPCPRRRGRTFRKWVRTFERMGYVVEWRELRACDFGAPTIRNRFFLIARCDGRPIVWPEPTHGDPKSEAVRSGRLNPWRTAAECIDWSIPMCSIFATKEEARAWGKAHGQASPIRPLAENTNRRIARGVKRYVLDNPRPYLVTLNHGGTWQRAWDLASPMKTVTSARDAHAVVSPLVAGVGGRAGQSPERSVDAPYQTVTAKGDAVVVAPVVVKSNHGDKPFTAVDEPLRTVVAGGTHHAIVGAGLAPRYGEREGQEPRCRSIEDPAPTVVTDGNGGSLVAASVSTFYGGPGGENRGVDPDEPLRTQGTENRFGVVASFLSQNNGGYFEGPGHSVEAPVSTVTCNSRGHHGLMGVALTKQRGTSTDADPQDPLDTISAGGTHHGIAAAHIQRDFGNSVGHGADEPIGTVTEKGGGKAALVASFLAKYYGTGDGQAMTEPVHTIPTVDRFGFVTVKVGKQTYVVEDIAMRMLQPKELYEAQGFRPGYIVDRGADGRVLTKTEQVRMCGNSVCPPVAEALIRANVPEMIVRELPKVKPQRKREVALAA